MLFGRDYGALQCKDKCFFLIFARFYPFSAFFVEKTVKSECDLAEIWKSGNRLGVFFVIL